MAWSSWLCAGFQRWTADVDCRTVRGLVALACVALACTPLASTDGTVTAHAVTADLPAAPATLEQRGVAVGLYFVDEGRSYRSYFWEAAQAGANAVSIVWAWRQPDGASVPVAEPGITVPESELRYAIGEAQAVGLDVMLLPILQLDEVAEGEWRGTIQPADRAAWWEAYSGLVRDTARIASDTGVAWLSVGSELGSMEQDEEQWRGLISDVRAVYGGGLTYSANWDHLHRTPFWDALDAIGVTGYFELTSADGHRPSADELDSAWVGVTARLQALAAAEGRPLIVTEVGYVSQNGAARYPWNYTRGRPLDLLAQYDLYAALVRGWSDVPELSGVYVWNWFGDGGSFDDGYTPRHKPAEHALRRWFGDGGAP